MLKPTDPFQLHQEVLQEVQAQGGAPAGAFPLWQPTEQEINETNLWHFMLKFKVREAFFVTYSNGVLPLT